MVAIVPLTIIGGLFLIVAHLPVAGWEARVAPYAPLLQIPVTATFGLLAVFACLAIAYDLGKRLNQEAIVERVDGDGRLPDAPDRPGERDPPDGRPRVRAGCSPRSSSRSSPSACRSSSPTATS